MYVYYCCQKLSKKDYLFKVTCMSEIIDQINFTIYIKEMPINRYGKLNIAIV